MQRINFALIIYSKIKKMEQANEKLSTLLEVIDLESKNDFKDIENLEKKTSLLSKIKKIILDVVAPNSNIDAVNDAVKKIRYTDIILMNSKNELLILQRSGNDDFQPNKWCLVGGKIDEGETEEEAVVRELMEETGIFVSMDDVEHIKQIEKDDCIIDYFYSQVNDVPEVILDNEEHFKYAWINPYYELNNYDFLLDLRDRIKDLFNIDENSNVDLNDIININVLDINDVFDIEISNEENLEEPFQEIQHAFHEIKKAFDENLISEEKYFEYKDKYDYFLKSVLTKQWVQVHKKDGTVYERRQLKGDGQDEYKTEQITPKDSAPSALLKDALMYSIKYKGKYYDKNGKEINVPEQYKEWANTNYDTENLDKLREFISSKEYSRLDDGKERAKKVIEKIKFNEEVKDIEDDIFNELYQKRIESTRKKYYNPQLYKDIIKNSLDEILSWRDGKTTVSQNKNIITTTTSGNQIPLPKLLEKLGTLKRTFKEDIDINIETTKGKFVQKLSSLINLLEKKQKEGVKFDTRVLDISTVKPLEEYGMDDFKPMLPQSEDLRNKAHQFAVEQVTKNREIKKSFLTIVDAFDKGLISEEKYFIGVEKYKEIQKANQVHSLEKRTVQVHRKDGSTFERKQNVRTDEDIKQERSAKKQDDLKNLKNKLQDSINYGGKNYDNNGNEIHHDLEHNDFVAKNLGTNDLDEFKTKIIQSFNNPIEGEKKAKEVIDKIKYNQKIDKRANEILDDLVEKRSKKAEAKKFYQPKHYVDKLENLSSQITDNNLDTVDMYNNISKMRSTFKNNQDIFIQTNIKGAVTTLDDLMAYFESKIEEGKIGSVNISSVKLTQDPKLKNINDFNIDDPEYPIMETQSKVMAINEINEEEGKKKKFTLLEPDEEGFSKVNYDKKISKIKKAFDDDEITLEEYINQKNELIKGENLFSDPSHGGNLIKKTIIDTNGKKQTKWVKKEIGGDNENEETNPFEKYGKDKTLEEHAKETPLSVLQQTAQESDKPELREQAHQEIARREKEEHVQEEDKKPLSGKDVKTGQKVTFNYNKNKEKAPYLGSRYGQDVEPSGFYVTQKESDYLPPNYETGKLTFNNPLVIDVDDDTLVSWKKDLSEQYGGKKNKALTNALKKDGYDGIITRHKKGYLGEIIAFNKEDKK